MTSGTANGADAGTARGREGQSAALVLSAVGLAFQALAGSLALAFSALWLGRGYWYGYRGFYMMGPGMMGYFGYPFYPYTALYAALVAVVIAVGLAGVALMASRDRERRMAGSVLVIVASVIAFPTMFGFIVGSLLMLVGGLLGLLEWGHAA
jgi:hypothetical protein